MQEDHLIARIRSNREERSGLTGRIEALDDELQGLVKEALDSRYGATELAKIMGVTRARVYQIRDGRR